MLAAHPRVIRTVNQEEMQPSTDYKTSRIFALEELSLCTTKDFIEWGYQTLEAGSDKVAVAILAGLNQGTSYFEARDCFLLAISEMGIEPSRGQQAIDNYFEQAAQAIVGGLSNYKEILKVAYEVTIKPGAQSSRFNISELANLYWAIQDLEFGEPSWSYYYEDLNTVSPEQSVRRECQIMLGLFPPNPLPKFNPAFLKGNEPTWVEKLKRLLGF
jgi:hypothetical protein